jgi:hypothetical protein
MISDTIKFLCSRRIAEVKILKPLFFFPQKPWKVSVRYYNPHWEERMTYRRYIYIESPDNVFVKESVEMIECENEEVAQGVKKKIEDKIKKCNFTNCFKNK